MHKRAAALLCILLLCCMVPGSLAQSLSCPEAHLVLTVPDSWTRIPLSALDDPDLCLLLEGGGISLSVYVSDTGGFLPDAFQVFTGDETDSGTVTVQGVEISYVAGETSSGGYWIYTWLDQHNQVQMYFLITGDRQSAPAVIRQIVNSLQFE